MKAFATYKCVDMTEGRGGMVIDKVFFRKKDAHDYVDDQPGIMGRRAKWSEQTSGDWQVRPLEILEHSVVDYTKKMAKLKISALNKLTNDEIKALGLSRK